MTDWIKIDDPERPAPKDGTRALVWIDLTGEHTANRSYARIACWDAHSERWRDGHSGPPLTITPTHWMPLPPPPPKPAERVMLCTCGQVLDSPRTYAEHCKAFPDHFIKSPPHP